MAARRLGRFPQFYSEVPRSQTSARLAPRLAGCTRVHSALAQGGVCFQSGPLREKTHQGRWRPQGPPIGLVERPAPQPVGPGSGSEPSPGPALRRTRRRNARGAWRAARPLDARPARSAYPADTPAASGFGRGVTPRGAAAERAGGTATAGEVGVFTGGNQSPRSHL